MGSGPEGWALDLVAVAQQWQAAEAGEAPPVGIGHLTALEFCFTSAERHEPKVQISFGSFSILCGTDELRK